MTTTPETPGGSETRVFHQEGGWTVPRLSPDVQECTSNYAPEREGVPPCTTVAVWKVVELYDLHATVGFWCDNDLPAEHRNAATAVLLGHVPPSVSTPTYAG